VKPEAGVPMTVPERAGVALRHWGTGVASTATELWLKPDRLLYVLWHGHPASFSEQYAYVKSQAWVPEELRGTGPGKVIWFLGVTYHALIAVPLKAFSRAFGAMVDKPLRFIALILLFVVLHFVLHVI
jgi:hypothetical protein